MDIIHSSTPASFMKIGYFEGYGVSRACNRVDIRDIDPSKYTHIHFAFATVTADTFQVNMGPTANQFYYFKQISGPKKILSFGGWTFSTDPATYGIFRTGVTAEHRDTMAKNIADFIVSNNLDGVDIDWEYPAAPDIPGIPAADPHEGTNYLLFILALKKYLPAGKTISFAAPASFWYLKGFPIAAISLFVDYIVYMTYDLHGQWDFKNKWSDPGCSDGNCLRSHINMTETMNALSMITKAGVPSNKVVVGVASYGRSFKMSSAGCTGPMCTFLGPESQAAKGKCTGTAGYISKTEIDDIIKNNPTAKTFKDNSFSDILVYDDTEWVAYMSDQNKATRTTLFKAFSFLGTSDWAIDLDVEKSVLPSTGPLTWYDPKGDGFKGPGGSAQIKLHNTCKQGKREAMLEEAWYEAGLLAKGMMQWNRNNKYQAAMDEYMGPQSRKVPWFKDFIWNNIRNHYTIHFGETPHPDDPPQTLINIWMYCDQSTVPAHIKKVNNVRCSKSATELVSAATYRFPSRGTSNYHILFCPPFFDAQPGVSPFNTLARLSEYGDAHEDFRLYIDDWATKVRAVTMFHEVVHFQDVSNPQCGGGEYYAPKATIGYARRTKDNQGYDKNVRNAHSWTLVAVATYMMQRWPEIGVPWPRELDGRPQKRSLVSTDDEDETLQLWGRDDIHNCTDSGAGGAGGPGTPPGCDPQNPAGGLGPPGGCDPGNCGDKGTPGGPGTGPSNPDFPGDDQMLRDWGIGDQSSAGGAGTSPMRYPGEIDDAPPDSGDFDPSQVDPTDFFWMNIRES
ncbi:hypothetical protein NLG97_g9764 [Lecanicillium saksenae]|uniref:Uncharacterized protein n=1 Tax=Lecanicillium saksenae TaxID=468837 RepID=A0ACC1QFL9_9HYPO|nr:hypothetical protein NLG97_g9764 [Lecanicillium saksenae]